MSSPPSETSDSHFESEISDGSLKPDLERSRLLQGCGDDGGAAEGGRVTAGVFGGARQTRSPPDDDPADEAAAADALVIGKGPKLDKKTLNSAVSSNSLGTTI